MNRAGAICNIEILRHAFEFHSKWFDLLRAEKEEKGKIMKGVRDAIEHRPVRFFASIGIPENSPPQYYILLHSEKPDVPRVDLMSALREIIEDMCILLTDVCASVDSSGEYTQRDNLIIVGNDDDYTGFWPQITP